MAPSPPRAETQPPLLYDVEGAVATLTLNRPEARNAVNFATLEALHAHLAEAAESSAVRCVALTGAGGVFCAGGDVKDMVSRRGKPLAVRERLRFMGRIVELIATMDKPVVALLPGDAVGAGATLALACDLIYAAEGARIGVPFAQVGLIPDTGGTWTLVRAVGPHKARELAFTGALLPAEQWVAWGVVAEVFPAAVAQTGFRERVERLAAGPTRTYGLAKRALRHAVTSTLAGALDWEAFAQGIAFTTQDHAEGVDAFIAKRKPQFRGE